MVGSRVASVVVLLLVACAAHGEPEPVAPGPAEGVYPSTPPPPADPTPYTPPPPTDPPPRADLKVAIASVQLIQDCPDPEPAGGVTEPAAAERAAQSVPRGASARSARPGDSFRQPCTQSTVQLSLTTDVAGPFRIEAARVLDAATQRVAGPARLRLPTRWDTGTYGPWDEVATPGQELKVSYRLGEPDLSQAPQTVGPTFSYSGPFLLELDVSVNGQRRTIRSTEFVREPPHVMVT